MKISIYRYLHCGYYLWVVLLEEGKCFVTHFFCSLLQITSVNICHKGTYEYLEVMEERWWLVAMDVLNTDKVAEHAVVDYDGATLDKEYVYFSGTSGERKNGAE